MNDPIQFLWVGPELSRLEQLSLKSFLYHGHDVHLYTYDRVANVPAGVVMKDGNDILSERLVFEQNHGKTSGGRGSVANFADRFRWQLLRQRGGYWADMDIICLKSLDFDTEIVFGKESEKTANIALLRFPVGHELVQSICNVIDKPFATYPWDSKKTKRRKLLRRLTGRTAYKDVRYGDLGVHLFTNMLRHFGLFDTGKPFTYFYPIHPHSWQNIFDETFKNDDSLFADTYTLHFWHEMTRREGDFDKNADFPKDSLIEKIRRQHSGD